MKDIMPVATAERFWFSQEDEGSPVHVTAVMTAEAGRPALELNMKGMELYAGHDVDKLREQISALQSQVEVLRDAYDGADRKHAERFEEMTTILVGYVMDKCGRKILVVDNEEIKNRFVTARVKRSVAKGGNIRYRLEDIPDGK